MGKKICLTALFLAEVLLSPLQSAGADLAVFDQFTEAFGAGLFQGVQIGSELNIESEGSSGSIQGVNVITNVSYSGKIAQAALLEQDVLLLMSGGNNVVQGINVYQGNADSVTQIASVAGSVTMSSLNNAGGIQGINVITSCDSCN